MTTYQFLTTAWRWNSTLLLFSALALVGYFLAFRRRGRPAYFGAALVICLFALVSPVSAWPTVIFSVRTCSAHPARAHCPRAFVVKFAAVVLASAPTRRLHSSVYQLDRRRWCDVALARARALQRGDNVEGHFRDSNYFAAINGKRVLVAGARPARGGTALTGRGNCLSVYRVHRLQHPGASF